MEKCEINNPVAR